MQFVEINHLIGDRTDAAHRLFVLDVTPSQWRRIQAGELKLPGNWSLDGAVHFSA